MAQNLPSGPGVNFKSPVIPKRLNIPPAPEIPKLPANIGSNVGNSLKGSLPSVPEAPKLPGIGAAPAVPAGEDPCSSAAYLKNKLKTMPLIGNMSLSDLTPNIDLDNLSAPKIPTMKEIGNKIGDGIKGIGDDISGAIKDIGDDVTGALEGLKPSNLLPNIKKEIGKVGRVALAGAIEDKMLDALGPVKAGIGNRIKRSVKTNLMMAGIDEVANIIAGEPNIFDPCAGKDKLKANAVANVGAAQSGKIQKQMNSAIAVKTKQAASSSNRMARDLQNPFAKPALPAIGALPPTPGGNPFSHETAVANNDAAVDKVADEAITEVAKEVSTTEAKNQDIAELEQEAAEKGESRSGTHTPPVERPAGVFDFRWWEPVWYYKNIPRRRSTWKKDTRKSFNEELPKVKKKALEGHIDPKRLDSITLAFAMVISGSVYEFKKEDFILLDKIPGFPDVFYSGWLHGELRKLEVANIVTGESMGGGFSINDTGGAVTDHLYTLRGSDNTEFSKKYPPFLMGEFSWENAQKGLGGGKTFFNQYILQNNGVRTLGSKAIVGEEPLEPLYSVPLYWTSHEEAIDGLFDIVMNEEVLDLVWDNNNATGKPYFANR